MCKVGASSSPRAGLGKRLQRRPGSSARFCEYCRLSFSSFPHFYSMCRSDTGCRGPPHERGMGLSSSPSIRALTTMALGSGSLGLVLCIVRSPCWASPVWSVVTQGPGCRSLDVTSSHVDVPSRHGALLPTLRDSCLLLKVEKVEKQEGILSGSVRHV